ncbi:MAG TPA: ribokinase [Tepidiformaceae bacterium]|nr:ribokinase [Tepidiformaceae bacterium]
MRIVVLGSCVVDVGMRVSRLPEPGETLFAEGAQVTLGGKGYNQAVAAARLGAEVTMLGKVGADEFGIQLLDGLTAEGVDTRFVPQDSRAATGLAVPLIFPDGSNRIISAPGANMLVTSDEVAGAASAIRAADLLLLQFEVATAANLRAATIARAAGVPVILNPAPAAALPPELAALISYLIPNEVEAAFLLQRPSLPGEAAGALFKPPLVAVIVTAGESGVVVADRDGAWELAAHEVDALDTVGAGDAFCGAFAVALAEGNDLRAAVTFANAAAAINVTRRGASAGLPTRPEVEALLAAR